MPPTPPPDPPAPGPTEAHGRNRAGGLNPAGAPAPGPIPARGPSPADNPRILAGRYRLDSVMGKGSMGTVWAATDEILHRRVAIKEIDFPPGTPAGERAQLEHRTLREARAIAALSNPYVITLFDILTLDNGPVIVMELLHARSLAEVLRKVGRLPDGQAATIGIAVASGLMAAHAAGITHRDVKPGNVLICDDGRIKLTDFGIARSAAEQTMTATGLLLGSPAYIAPEVASGVPAGPISDAWSLGGLLFATVEGRPPFDQGTAIATLTSVVKDPVPPHPHSGRLGPVVSGLLVKTPSLRMRIERALVTMRGIADDPSGTNLAAVSRIPRDHVNASGQRAAATGHSTVAQQQPIGRPSGHGRTSPQPYPAPGPPAHSPADASTGPPGLSPARPRPAVGQPFPAGRSETSAALPGAQTPRAAHPPAAPPRPTPATSTGHRTNNPVGSARLPRPMNVGAGEPVLPPPPWASSDAAALPALPAAATEPRHRVRVIAAVLVALAAAVAGYFGVRIIADVSSSGASGIAGSSSPSIERASPDLASDGRAAATSR